MSLTAEPIVTATEAPREAAIKELEVTVTVRNNRLKERRLRLGLSAKDLSEKLKITYVTYLALEGLRLSPFCRAKKGRPGDDHRQQVFRKTVKRLARFYKVSPWDLFPPSVLEIEDAKAVRTLDADDLRALNGGLASGMHCLNPHDIQETGEEIEQLQRLMVTMPKTERRVLELRRGLGDEVEHTCKEVSDILRAEGLAKCGAARVGDIEARAIRRLRDHSERLLNGTLESRVAFEERLAEREEYRRKRQQERLEEERAYRLAERESQKQLARMRAEAEARERERYARFVDVPAPPAPPPTLAEEYRDARREHPLRLYRTKDGWHLCSYCGSAIRAIDTAQFGLVPCCVECCPKWYLHGPCVGLFHVLMMKHVTARITTADGQALTYPPVPGEDTERERGAR